MVGALLSRLVGVGFWKGALASDAACAISRVTGALFSRPVAIGSRKVVLASDALCEIGLVVGSHAHPQMAHCAL